MSDVLIRLVMDGDPETLKKAAFTKYRTQSMAQILKVVLFIPCVATL